MPTTYEPIATTTLGSAALTITFSSIPSTYTDLRLVLLLNDSNAGNIALNFNSDTGTNYSFTRLLGNGSTASSVRVANRTYAQVGEAAYSAGAFSFSTVDVFSYAGSTNKTILATTGVDESGNERVQTNVNLWRNTSAINSIQIGTDAGTNLRVGSTATLYGIKAA